MNIIVKRRLILFAMSSVLFSFQVFGTEGESPSSTESSESKPKLTKEITSTTIGEIRGDNQNGQLDDDNYQIAIERLNLKAGYGRHQAWIRLDAFGLRDAPSDAYRSLAVLERAKYEVQLNRWKVELGDHYEQYGRGFVLSLRKLDEAGIDITVRGGRVSYQYGRHQARASIGLANTVNIDPVSQRFTLNVNDIVGGGNYTYRMKNGNGFSLFSSFIQPQFSLIPDVKDQTLSAGLSLDLVKITPWLSGYFEIDQQRRMLAGNEFSGSVYYGSLLAQFGQLSALFEGQKMSNWRIEGSQNSAVQNQFIYNRPTTLMRLDQEIFDIVDVEGARIRLDYFDIERNLGFYIDGTYRFEGLPETTGFRVRHAFAGARKAYAGGASRFELQLGYRDDYFATQGEFYRTIYHFDIDAVHELGKGVALHVTSNTQLRRFGKKPALFGSSFFGVEKAGLGGATFELGYDTVNQFPGIRRLFYAGILSWEPKDWLKLRGTFGHQRGGLKCVAGVCRIYPAFSGIRLAVVTRF